MKRFPYIMRPLAFLFCVAIMLSVMTEIVKDKRMSFLYDVTRKVEGFYNEPKNSLDFVFIGSSELFSTIVPAVLWQEHGMTSYDFGASEQPLWLSYYYMQEALKTQKPKAIVVEVYYAFFQENYQRTPVNRINIDDIKWSKNKMDMILSSVPRAEWLDFVFALSLYHANWENLNGEHVLYAYWRGDNPYKGYTPYLYDHKYYAYDIQKYRPELANEKGTLPLSQKSSVYLHKIIALAREKGVDLIFLKTPDGSLDSKKYANSVAEIAQKNNILFVDYNSIMPGEIHNGILHAEKITSHFGDILAQRYQIEDKRQDPRYAEWQADAKVFYQLKLAFLHRTVTAGNVASGK